MDTSHPSTGKRYILARTGDEAERRLAEMDAEFTRKGRKIPVGNVIEALSRRGQFARSVNMGRPKQRLRDVLAPALRWIQRVC